jgi:hypothetical protein
VELRIVEVPGLGSGCSRPKGLRVSVCEHVVNASCATASMNRIDWQLGSIHVYAILCRAELKRATYFVGATGSQEL